MSKSDIEKIRLQSVLKRHGFVFKKKYGQNFLTDMSILEDIADAAEVSEEDFCLEIGPGMGTLTRILSKRSSGVLAIEIDEKLKPVLDEELEGYGNVEVIYADVMSLDLPDLLNERAAGKNIKVVANLPYYITTPIIMMLLESKLSYERITVMVQKEVAERMKSQPGVKSYGAITLAVSYYTNAEIAFVLPPEAFYPPPKVESAVINLIRHKKHPVEVKDEGFMFSLIRAAFNQRRKTLVNAISNQMDIDKDELKKVITDCGHSETVRGEALSLEDFSVLADGLSNNRKGN